MLGAVLATTAFCLPSVILVAFLLRFLSHFADYPWVKGFLQGLRPAILALLTSIAFSFVQRGVDNLFSVVLLTGGFLLLWLVRRI